MKYQCLRIHRSNFYLLCVRLQKSSEMLEYCLITNNRYSLQYLLNLDVNYFVVK